MTNPTLSFIPANWGPWLLGGSFIAVALWLLIPDKDDSEDSAMLKYGAFAASCMLFFLAEIGDKTQIATVILAASFENSVWMVIWGTTLGMLAANVPVVYAGKLVTAKNSAALGTPGRLCGIYGAWAAGDYWRLRASFFFKNNSADGLRYLITSVIFLILRV